MSERTSGIWGISAIKIFHEEMMEELKRPSVLVVGPNMKKEAEKILKEPVKEPAKEIVMVKSFPKPEKKQKGKRF